MSKKKLLSLVAFAIAVFYVVSCGSIFALGVEIHARNFTDRAEKDYAGIKQMIDATDNIEKMQYSSRLTMSTYPNVFALTGSDGTVIFDSSPALIVDYCDEHETYIKTFVIKMEKYMTQQINSLFTDRASLKNWMGFRFRSLSVCTDGEEYIPVQGVLYNDRQQEGEETVIRFSDREPDFTVYEQYGSVIFFNCFQGSRNRVYQKYSRLLQKNLKAHIASFSQTHTQATYNSGGGVSGNGIYQYEEHFEKNGKKYCLYYDTRYNLYYDVLTGNLFQGMALTIGLIFAAVAVLLLVILAKLYDKNRQITKSREAFVAAAAHELKTPIAVIANESECILEDISPQLTKSYVNSIYDESKRMSRMVNTLLQYNTLSQGTKTKKRKEPLYLIAASQVSKYQSLLQAKEITLHADIPEDMTLYCNRELLSLAVDNFLSNAVRHTPCNGEIGITAVRSKGKVRFEVFNSGSSVEAEDAPHIWEELYSGSEARTRTQAEHTTGMGLSICKRIFELHNYRYGCQNTKNGVIFWFSER